MRSTPAMWILRAMRWRLPQILAVLALVLLAGVLSVQHVERTMGGATVPGLVLVDASWLGAGDVAALRRRWPDLTSEWLEAAGPGLTPAGALAPFDAALLDALASRGDRTILLSLDPGLGRAAAEAARTPVGDPRWHAVLDTFPDVASRSTLSVLTDSLADFLRRQSGTRAFVAAVLLGDEQSRNPVQTFEPVVAALHTLPSFRRSSLVILGRRRGDGQRLALRIDRGPWKERARPGLADLLDPRW